MGKSDHEYFNCSEKHEIDYVANQYTKPADVRKFIEGKCISGVISNWTHAKLYGYLKDNDYIKK